MLLEADRSHLVIVDVQSRLMPAMSGLEPMRERLDLLLTAAREFKVPVTLTEQYPSGLGGTDPAVVAAAGPDAWTIGKMTFNALAEPEIAARLKGLATRSQKRDQLVITGMESHVCVLQTAMAAQAAGYRVALVADAVASRREESRTLALSRMAQAGIVIVNAEMVAFEWLQRAGTPVFKQLIARIK
jgi:nicotinamidase-related amidase